MADGKIIIESEFWNGLFPFHAAFNESLHLTRVGRAMSKIEMSMDIGKSVRDFLNLEGDDNDWNYLALRDNRPGKLVVATTSNSGITLRGQLVPLENELIYVGSPIAEMDERLQQLGIGIESFAPFDATVECMVMRQTQQTQMTDLTSMIEELRHSAGERDRLAKIEESLAHDLNAAGDIVMRLSPDGEILDARCSNQNYFDHSTSSLIGQDARAAIPRLFTSIDNAIRQLGSDEYTNTFQCQHKSSCGEYWFEGRIAPTLTDDYLILARDVTDKRKLEIELEHRATHDPLTDLANRLTFEQRVQKELQRHADFSLVFIDLDGFKDVNDSFGHQYGDRLLIETAARLTRVFHTDLVARLGGDEFGILVSTNTSKEELKRKCDRAIELAGRSIMIDGHVFSIGLSVGVSDMRNCQPRNAETLFKSADLAMYRAKSEKLGVVFFENEMLDEYRQRKKLLQEFQTAIDESRIIPHYQPIIDLIDYRVAGIEALARWRHPVRGILLPSVFIDLAEESGMVIEMGNQILRRACHDGFVLNAKRGDFPIAVNVNISALQLQCDEFPGYVSSILQETSLDPGLLTLEITESMLLKDFEKALASINRLKSLGVQIALDDFGTGHSSLIYLDAFPIDILKLDRSFVKQINDNAERKKRLVKSIIALGNALEMKIVAEGIEQVSQQDLVEFYGCRFAQGYLYAAPMTMREMTDFVASFNNRRAVTPTGSVLGVSGPTDSSMMQSSSEM